MREVHVQIGWLLTVTVAVAHGTPVIVRDPIVVSEPVYEGHTATLSCQIVNLTEGYEAAWTKNGTIIATGTTNLKGEAAKYTAVGPCPCESGDYKLIVSKVEYRDGYDEFDCNILQNETIVKRSNNAGKINTGDIIKITPRNTPVCYPESLALEYVPGDRIITTCLIRNESHGNFELHWKRGERNISGSAVESDLPDISDEWVLHENDHGQNIECVALLDSSPPKSCSIGPFEVKNVAIALELIEDSSGDLLFRCNLVEANLDATFTWIYDDALVRSSDNDRFILADKGRSFTIKYVSHEDHDKLVQCFAHADNINDKYKSYRISRPPPTTTTSAEPTTTAPMNTRCSPHSDDPPLSCIVVMMCLAVAVFFLTIALMSVIVYFKRRNQASKDANQDQCRETVGYVNGDFAATHAWEDGNQDENGENSPDVDTPETTNGARPYDEQNALHYDSCDIIDRIENHGLGRQKYANGAITAPNRHGSAGTSYEVVDLDATARPAEQSKESSADYKSLKRIDSPYTALKFAAEKFREAAPKSTTKPKPKVRQKPARLPFKSYKKDKTDQAKTNGSAPPEVKPKPKPPPKIKADDRHKPSPSQDIANGDQRHRIDLATKGITPWKVMP